ncbi:MAG: ammonium transporter [Thermoplasmata archaeon]
MIPNVVVNILSNYKYLANNLWVVIAALLVFVMTISVGFLEIGELGLEYTESLIKTITITGTAIFVMAIVGFNTAFAPTIGGIIGNPLYGPGFLLGGFSGSVSGLLSGIWWSTGSSYFGTGLTTGTYFLFEAASASVTFALVSVIALKKIKFSALFIFSVVYFTIIWNLPAAWIWNPSGWLYLMGMRDFAGGLVVHAAAGVAGLAIVYQIWREEKARGLKESPQVKIKVSAGWLTLSILLLWVGWFGFNTGSVLAFNSDVLVVVITTFLAASASFISVMFFRYLQTKENPGLLYAVNGILMGLIIITPLAGFVSPGSAFILGLIGGPLFLAGEKFFSRFKWFTDPVGLFPSHFLGGAFGLTMIAFFTQTPFATASGNSNLPNGLLFGGGIMALKQLGIEEFGLVIVLVAVFALSFATIWIISKAIHGITVSEKAPEKIKFTAPVLNLAPKKDIEWIDFQDEQKDEEGFDKTVPKK